MENQNEIRYEHLKYFVVLPDILAGGLVRLLLSGVYPENGQHNGYY